MRDLRLYVEAVKRSLGRGEVARYLLLEADQRVAPGPHLRGVARVIVMAPGAGQDLDVRLAAVLADTFVRSVDHVASDTQCSGHRSDGVENEQASSVEHPERDSAEPRTPGRPDPQNRKDRST